VVRGKVSAEPLSLTRTGFAAADFLALAVQDNDMPGAKLIAVIAVLGVSGGGTETVEIRSRAGGMKFVIAGSGAGARFYAAPGLVVAVIELFLRTIRIS